jgi:hypothetical protein
MNFPVGGSANTRVLIRNLILRQRNINDSFQITSGTTPMNYGTILEPAQPYLGVVADYNTPINRDSFIVKKQFKRAISSDYDGTSFADGVAESYVFFNYTMTFGKGKELNYRTGGSTYPEDFPYFLAQSASNLGSNTALATGLVSFALTCTPYFYDV